MASIFMKTESIVVNKSNETCYKQAIVEIYLRRLITMEYVTQKV